MSDFKAFLIKLRQNLNILQEREAKYGGNTPLELVNQISDHREAVALTEQALRNELSEDDWRQALQPLLVAIQARTGDEVASSVTLGDIGGGIHQSTIAGRDVNQITLNVVTLLGQAVSGEGQALSPSVQAILEVALAQVKTVDPRTAQKYPENPAGYEAPLSDALTDLLQADRGLAARLEALLAQYEQAIQGQVSPYQTSLRAAYLNRLLESASQLSLAGIDRKAASSEAETRLNLSAVYTALLTLSQEQSERLERGEKPKPVSALAQLNRHARLVLLGDPGSGKSTFVNFVTLCLAGELLGQPQANLNQLTAPLPADEGKEEAEPQRWEHGPLLPVRIILRDFAARGLPPLEEPATAQHLWRFIAAELKTAALADYARALSQELHQQGGLLLLDGLDEVPEANERRVQLRQAIEDFAKTFPRCRLVVTSRTYAYQKQAWRLPGFAEASLAPFSQGQIQAFVERWYRHIAPLRGLRPEAAQGQAELLKRAIFSSERLRELAERPLLLTLMASLHAWRGGTLPEKREELYADAVELLLDWWESPKVVKNAQGQAVVLQPSLAEWLAVDRERVRALLNELAYEAHHSQPQLTGTADVPEGALVGGLLRLSQNPDLKPARLVEYLSQRAGLLLPRGVGVYTFPHRTFQEYLAACHLTDDPNYPDQAAELARNEPNRWREVVLLAGAKAARGTAPSIWQLVEALCYREPPPETSKVSKTFEVYEAADAWGALLAGQALAETANLAQISARHRPKLERVRAWLVHLLQPTELPALERARAGTILAQLGDPRPGVGLRLDSLPDIIWCDVPAGPFVMGEEGEQRQVDLPAFRISRYPITHAQYAAFVADGGYTEKWRQCWTEAGWQDKKDRQGRRQFGGVFDLPNHPVVGVTWYEAVAFCRWLTFRLQASGEVGPGQEISLPTEPQWEKAARGSDGRIYPWGNEADPNRANYDDTGIGATSAVGCFPAGATPYGCEEMSGNVWEWCRTQYNEPDNEELEGGDDVPRVLRGGAFYNTVGFVRCSIRYWSDPFNWYFNFGFRVVAAVSPS